MEENMPVIARKVWQVVRIAFFMLRKGISKKKLLLDLNLMMKKRKHNARKALSHFSIFHHHHNHHNHHGEYEFSCSNTPFYKRKPHHHHKNNLMVVATPLNNNGYDDEVVVLDEKDMEAVNKVLDMMMLTSGGGGRWPRVMESPLPVVEMENGVADDVDDANYVDKAADEFIRRFYSQLNKQLY